MKKLPEKALLGLLEQLGLSPEDKVDYFKVVCPECGSKEAFVYKNNILIVCSRKNKCGYNGSVLELARKEKAFKKNILKDAGLSEPSKKEEIKEKAKLIIPDGLTFFSEGNPDGFIYKKAYNYLKSRNINNVEQLGYVYNPSSEIELGIFIPFYENEELVYYIIRNTSSSAKKRYDNPHGINAGEFMYNYDNIKFNDTFFITEGVFDALSVENYIGTAMLTSTISKKQASKFFDKAPKNIIYIPDNDEAGFKNIEKNINTLIRYKPPSLDTNFYIYYIPKEYKDLNDFSSEKGKINLNLKECILFEEYKKNKSIPIKRKSPL